MLLYCNFQNSKTLTVGWIILCWKWDNLHGCQVLCFCKFNSTLFHTSEQRDSALHRRMLPLCQPLYKSHNCFKVFLCKSMEINILRQLMNIFLPYLPLPPTAVSWEEMPTPWWGSENERLFLLWTCTQHVSAQLRVWPQCQLWLADSSL